MSINPLLNIGHTLIFTFFKQYNYKTHQDTPSPYNLRGLLDMDYAHQTLLLFCLGTGVPRLCAGFGMSSSASLAYS